MSFILQDTGINYALLAYNLLALNQQNISWPEHYHYLMTGFIFM